MQITNSSGISTFMLASRQDLKRPGTWDFSTFYVKCLLLQNCPATFPLISPVPHAFTSRNTYCPLTWPPSLGRGVEVPCGTPHSLVYCLGLSVNCVAKSSFLLRHQVLVHILSSLLPTRWVPNSWLGLSQGPSVADIWTMNHLFQNKMKIYNISPKAQDINLTCCQIKPFILILYKMKRTVSIS